MPLTIKLPPDPDDLGVDFTVPKALVPYVLELYDFLAGEDESMDDFLCRFVCERSVRERTHRVLDAEARRRRKEQAEDEKAANAEAAEILTP